MLGIALERKVHCANESGHQNHSPVVHVSRLTWKAAPLGRQILPLGRRFGPTSNYSLGAVSKMINTKMNDSDIANENSIPDASRRYQYLVETLQSAKKSLEDWQDQRTEALITLDSFSYDLRQLEAEKHQIREEYEECVRVFQAKEKSLQEQVLSLTLKSEEWRARFEESETKSKNLVAEREHFKAIAEQEKQNQIEVRAKCEFEKNALVKELDGRIEEARIEDAQRIEKLIRDLQILAGEKERAEYRSRRAEQELQAFRAQILGIMKESEEGQLSIRETVSAKPEVAPVEIEEPVTNRRVEVSANANNDIENENPASEVPEENGNPSVHTTVYEYLKRLGY